MKFEWDSDKDAANRRKHGLSFGLATAVFNDPYHLSIQDRHEDGEERWQAIGNINGVAVVLVAHTFVENDGKEVIRIISARKATPVERRAYEKNAFNA